MTTAPHSVDVWPLLCDIEVVTSGDPRDDDYVTECPTEDDLYAAMKWLIDDNLDIIEDRLAGIVAERKQQLAKELSE